MFSRLSSGIRNCQFHKSKQQSPCLPIRTGKQENKSVPEYWQMKPIIKTISLAILKKKKKILTLSKFRKKRIHFFFLVPKNNSYWDEVFRQVTSEGHKGPWWGRNQSLCPQGLQVLSPGRDCACSEMTDLSHQFLQGGICWCASPSR